LRTRIAVEEGEPVQVIEEWEARGLEVKDLSSLSLQEREEEARRIAGAEAVAGFDLSRGPMLRVTALMLEEEEHIVLFTLHHIVSDGWSMGILIREVGTLYQAYRAGKESPLGELPIQYADFAAWQKQWLKGEALERELEYWRKQLAGLETLELPTDYPRPAAPSYRGASHHFVVEGELAERLKSLGQRKGVTLFMTLLGGFDVLMSRYSGQEDVALGTDIANRNRAEIEGVIGFFVNQLVMRVGVRPEESFAELLERVREVCLGAYAHQDVPFEKLVEELRPERDLSRSPLFQTKLILQNAPGEDLALEGMRLSIVGGEAKTARFDLTVAITDAGRDLYGVVEYSRDLYEEGTIERLMDHYKNVLSGVAEDSSRRICDLNLLNDREREQIVVEWNQTGRPYPNDRRVHELFAEQAERTPDRTALIGDGQEITYRELNRRANQLAAYLQRLGVGPETLVGLYLDRSVEMVVAMLGALKSGGAYLPLDSEYPLERLSFMLEDARVGIVVTDQELEARLPAFLGKTVLMDLEWERINRESDSEPKSETVAENLAYVIYTSGSTGAPKGVAVQHRALVARTTALLEAFELSSADRLLGLVSPSFDAFGEEVFTTLSCGAGLIIDRHAIHYPAQDLLGLIESLAITTLHSTIAYWHQLVDEVSSSQGRIPSQLRLCIAGGERTSISKLEQWAVVTGHQSRFVNAYGPTEATITSTVYGTDMGSSRNSLQTGAPIGRPIANTQIYILDRNRQVTPIGVRGELYIGGAGVARGYLGRAEISAEKFVPDGFGEEPGERLYRTGDVGRYLEDGKIEFLGRVDDQVKLRGYRIELGEVESALNQHQSVRQCVVVVEENEGGAKRLLGYVVGEEGSTAAELKRHLREKLPEYMIPQTILILDAMPVTPNGKIDRKRLLLLKDAETQLEPEYVAARTPVEEILVGIFEESLKLDRVGIRDNFFEIGGHSLLATQVVSRVREIFGAEIEVRNIFEAPTVEALGRRIEEAIRAGEKREAPPLIRVPRNGRAPLSFAQQRLWFIEQLKPGDAVYNCSAAVRLEGRLNLEALEGAINEIIKRHEVLRTRIEVEAATPAQVIEGWEWRRLRVEDLMSLIPEEREKEARRIMREEAGRGFDLRRGPLMRVMALRLGEDQHILIFTMHHIVSDGWSMEVLVREMCVLYEAMSEGKGSPLKELEIQYADYAKWQREYLAGGVMENEIEYWKERLKDAAIIELPTDHARPAEPSYRGGEVKVAIDKELIEGLRRLSQREGGTLFMALMAAFKVLLMRYSGEEDVSVGTAIANRTRREIEGLIGFFVNTLVMRTDLGGNPSFRELVKREREVALGAYARQEAPFEKLVEEINPNRDLSRSPLFQVMMVLQNTGRAGIDLRGLKVREIDDETKTAKFDLTLMLVEGREGIAGCLGYSHDLYEEETIRRMVRHYEKLVKEVVRDAEQRVREIDLMSAAEKEHVLVEFNRTERKFERAHCIHELIEMQAERRQGETAVVYEEEVVTYGELNARANQLAHHLRKLGVGPEALVGLCLERSVEMVVGLLGVLKAGGAYVPLDPSYPSERLTFMLEDAQVSVLLTQERLLPFLPAHVARVISLDRDWSDIGNESAENPEKWGEFANPAYVIYTSGSTGRPKGVVIAHGAIMNHMLWMQESFPLDERDRVLQKTPFSFDASVWEFFAPLLVGGQLIVARPGGHQDSSYLARLIIEREVTILQVVPSMLRILLGEPEMERCQSLRRVFCGGEVLTPDLRDQFFSRLSAELHNLYGPTEATIDATSWSCRRDEKSTREAVPIGRPVANVKAYVFDEWLEPTPVGVVGELYLGGAGVGLGYLRRPEMTAERFIPHRFSAEPGERLYRTGDLVRYLPDGNLGFLGRMDDQVKIRGYRIELAEIERVLEQEPWIQGAVVVVRAGALGRRQLVAYVVGDGERERETTRLRKYLKEKLPDYMVPSAIVVLDRMPLTPNGKLDRDALPNPEQELRGGGTADVPPRTLVEEILAEIFKQSLNLDRIGIHDNFFELGGDSILSIQIVSKANEAGLGLTPKQLFQHQSIAELAAVVGQAGVIELEEGNVGGEVPLTPIQKQFFERDDEEPEHFNQAVMLEVKEYLDVELLRKVIGQLVKQHDILKHRFLRTEGGWRQVREEVDGGLALEEIDISTAGESLESEVIEEAAEKYQKGMNLEKGPLMRIVVFGVDQGRRQRVLIVAHHLIIDGVSWRILLGDFERGYEQAKSGEGINLGAKTTSYKRWAERLKEEAQSKRLREEAGYWLLGDGKGVRRLPTDRGGVNTMASSMDVITSLNEEETGWLLEKVPKTYKAQINEVLLSAVARSVSEWSREQAVLVEIDGHGREEIVEDVDLARTVGWFTSVYPVKLEVRSESNVELLQSVMEQVRKVSRRGIYYGILKYLSEESDIREKLRALPQAEISFNYLGRLDLVLREGSLFRIAKERVGKTRSSKEKRQHLIEINGSVSGGRLHMVWSYSENAHRRETIAALAERTIEVLREVVAGCP
jgi:amino acid adenylation domain-containing protein/non-ribosomal peptide synthase protein (TIGR01720 family)